VKRVSRPEDPDERHRDGREDEHTSQDRSAVGHEHPREREREHATSDETAVNASALAGITPRSESALLAHENVDERVVARRIDPSATIGASTPDPTARRRSSELFTR